jgi:hypothetical protein
MRFVEDEQIELARANRCHPASGSVIRSNPVGPLIKVGKSRANSWLSDEPELALQFLAPLIHQAFGADDKYALDPPSLEKFSGYQQGGYGFPEPDIVGDHASGLKPAEEKDRILDLVRERIHIGQRQGDEILPPVDVERG